MQKSTPRHDEYLDSGSHVFLFNVRKCHHYKSVLSIFGTVFCRLHNVNENEENEADGKCCFSWSTYM